MNALDEPLSKKVKFSFVSVPLACKVEVPIVPVWTAGKGSMLYFDEHCNGERSKTLVLKEDLDDCFFSINVDLLPDEGVVECKELPRGFYANEFMTLDPCDIQEFLAFQRRYGMVYGAREHKPFGTKLNERLRPSPNQNLFAGINSDLYAEQLKGILSSQKLYDSMLDEEYLDTYSELVKMAAVSFRESIAVVIDAQAAIKDVMTLRKTDKDAITKRDAINAEVSTHYIARHLMELFPPIELAIDGESVRRTDLITAVFAQTAKALLTNEAMRTCENPECGRVFTPSEMQRRSDTKYCSSECQERAKRLRYLARHPKHA